MSFTVLVVLHDSRRELAVLLDSLERHLPTRPQLVVVDSGSSDDGAALAAARGADVLVLDGNPGFGAANNAGLALAREDVTVLLNPDIELLDDGLEGLVSEARERDALIVPRLLNPDGTVQRSAHPMPGTVRALLPALVPTPLLPRPLRVHADPWRSDRPRDLGWAIAAALVARTTTLRRLGPFDAEAFLLYEDLDLCLRARAEAVPTELRPDVSLRHTGGHSVNRRGEPHALHATRRREVVGRQLGARALVLDDAAQALTFVTRGAAKRVLGRPAQRERDQLTALREARRLPANGPREPR
jgi:N-acetylglucosaminyl-diphospho-decaprenol L-rhamnosyltransferase